MNPVVDLESVAAKPTEGRGLSRWMLDEFLRPEGLLHPLLRAVRKDTGQRLDLAIRDHYVNLYYMGTNLMEIREPGRNGQRITTFWDERYLPHHADRPWADKATKEELAVEAWLEKHNVLGRKDLVCAEDVIRHVDSIPYRMKAMAACKKHHPKRERLVQQEAARLCNASGDSEYLACDMEYAFEHDRHSGQGSYLRSRKTSSIDLVAAWRRPDAAADAPARLVLIEFKYAENALDGPSGLRSHVRDVGRFLEENGNHTRIAEGMVRVMRQRRELGVVPTAVRRFDLSSSVDYLIAVANHKAKSQKLHDALLGRYGLDEGPLETPEGMAISVVTLDASQPRLDGCRPVALEEILAGPTPGWLFNGRLVQRRWRKDEMPPQ